MLRILLLLLISLPAVATIRPCAGQETDAPLAAMPVEEAITAIGSPDVAMRRRAALALFESREDAKRAVPMIADIIRTQAPNLPAEPLVVLEVLGPDAEGAVPAIVEYLAKYAPDVEPRVLHALVAIGPGGKDAVPSLIKICDSSNLHCRYLACRALGSIGPAAKPAVGELIRRLQYDANTQPEPVNVASVRRNAANALGRLGGAVAPEAVPMLIEAMADPSSPVRDEATLALGFFGEAGKAAIPQLRQRLENASSPQRTKAALSLWRLNSDASEVLPHLIEHLESGPQGYEAAVVLSVMGPAAAPAVPALIRTLGQQDETTLLTAIDALGSIGPAASVALPSLQTLLANDDPSVRQAAEQAIEKIK